MNQVYNLIQTHKTYLVHKINGRDSQNHGHFSLKISLIYRLNTNRCAAV
jgi:hypothetical protein